MVNKSLFRFALLLSLGAFMMSVSAGEPNTEAIEKLVVGTFRMTSDPKKNDFNAFLKAMEYSKKDRDTARNAPTVHVIFKKEGDEEYNMKIEAGPIKAADVTFKLGEEFEDKLFDGRAFKATVTFEGDNKMIRKEKHSGFECTHESEFTEKGFTTAMECNGVKATQKFKREEGKKPKAVGGVANLGKMGR